jgi:hypothetical protein
MELTDMTPTDKWKRKVLEFCDANNTTIESICYRIKYSNSKKMREYFTEDKHDITNRTKEKIDSYIENGI